jgi:hypothetical protein
VVSGTRTLTLPFAARVLEYNSEIIKEPGTLLSADSVRCMLVLYPRELVCMLVVCICQVFD